MTQEKLGNIEQIDDRLRKARELVEDINNWHAQQRLSFIDRYVSGEMHIALRRSLPDEAKYGFVIVHHHEAGGDGRVVSSESGTNYLKKAVIRGDGEKFSVLAHDVELMKSPKVFIPSFVRIPMKSATHSNAKLATDSDLKPPTVPI